AVDEQDVGMDRLLVAARPEAAGHYLANGREVIDPLHRFDLVAPVAGLERQAVDEMNERRDRVLAAEGRDVDPLDGPRPLGQPERFLESRQSLLRLDGEDLRLHVPGRVAAHAEVAEGVDVVAQARGPLELEGGARLPHLLLHLVDQLLLLSLQYEPQRPDLLAILLLRDAEVARGRALVDAVQEAGAEPAPARVFLLDVERAGAELEDALEYLHRVAQALSARERPVEPHAAPARAARELDPRELLADADLQIGEGLVVFQLDVETRLDVLDKPRFHEQGVHLALADDVVDVGNERHEVAGAMVLEGRLGEIMRDAVAQVLR